MDPLAEELIRFWRTLNDNKAKYIMVGAFAVRFHGYNRATDNLDIWIEDTAEIPPITDIQLNIISQMTGLPPFKECLKTAAIATINNIPVPYLNINLLIENKKALNRPIDQVDVIQLEKIREILNTDCIG